MKLKPVKTPAPPVTAKLKLWIGTLVEDWQLLAAETVLEASVIVEVTIYS